MKAKLINAPDNALKLLDTACRTCTSDKEPADIFEDNKSDEQMIKTVKSVIKSKHHSVLEHVYLTFAISGVSRACTHQLVRHRHASFSQKSQRYVTETGQFDYIVPESIEEHVNHHGGSPDYLLNQYNALMKSISIVYSNLIDEGIPPEDARSVLPNAATSSLVMSFNIREFIHICNERLCNRAQQEIRELVGLMKKEALEVYPFMEEYLVPKCLTIGYCEERKSCGMKKKKAEVVKI